MLFICKTEFENKFKTNLNAFGEDWFILVRRFFAFCLSFVVANLSSLNYRSLFKEERFASWILAKRKIL